MTCAHPNRIGPPECRCPDCGAFQDNEGRWCISVHVTTEPCDECGRSGFHKHYLATPTEEEVARLTAVNGRLAQVITRYNAGANEGLTAELLRQKAAAWDEGARAVCGSEQVFAHGWQSENPYRAGGA